jgi:Na+/H+ antiporter NhaD/arsenite permease-like protein
MRVGAKPLLLRGGATPAALQLAAAPAAPPAAPAELPWGALATSGLLLLALTPLLLRLPRDAAITAASVAVSLLQMALLDAPPEQALLEGVLSLLWCGVLSLKQTLAGFASEGVVAVGVMCAVARAVKTTGGLELIARLLLGRPASRLAALFRLLLPTLLISACLNNTPVCAMLAPVAATWAASLSPPVAQKQLLMPLSFATMLGGTITLIGSSTNIVAAEAARKHDPSSPMTMFGITPVGALASLGFFLAAASFCN